MIARLAGGLNTFQRQIGRGLARERTRVLRE